MHVQNSALYVFETRGEADSALRSFARSRFNLKQLSLIGKGYHSYEEPVGFYIVGDHVKSWGTNGAFWGGVWGKLLSPAVFFLPGLGMIAMAGPVVAAVIAALEGVVVVEGASALGAALTMFGAPRDQVEKYEQAVKADKYVLVVHGDIDDALKAQSILTDSREVETA